MYYENFEELLNDKPKLAKELLDEIGEGEWQNENIQYFVDTEEFAVYEIEEGWYADLGISSESSYDGAPNLMDYIDIDSLGEVLSNSWDESMYFKSSTGEVIKTYYGW